MIDWFINILKSDNPSPVGHRVVSFAKSGLRILAGIFLCASMFMSAGVLFILAELLGILEEIV